jgi:hypothetical protein
MITSRASAAIARLIAASWRLAIEDPHARAKGSSEAPMRAIAASAVRVSCASSPGAADRDGADAMFSATVRLGNSDSR